MLLDQKKNRPLKFSAYTLLTALGEGLSANWDCLLNKKSMLRQCDFEDVDLKTYIGRVQGVEDIKFPDKFANFDCRNNRLIYKALNLDGFADHVFKAINKYGASRVGIALGTTTSGFLHAEKAYKSSNLDISSGNLPADFPYKETAHPFASALFLQKYFNIKGPAITVGTACSSSAKTFAHADRWISAGLCDAVLVAGADSLCKSSLYGFSSLDVLSEQLCRPSDKNRNGLSLGEGAGLVLVEAGNNQNNNKNNIGMLGYGESSDAFHMSSPHPEGKGIMSAMNQALKSSGLGINDIDYINLHGTASYLNDKYENKGVYELFSDKTPSSSVKGWAGHCLGASGVIEAIMSALFIKNNLKPASLNTQIIDPEIKSNILLEHERGDVNAVLSNSCGFGGSNCSLLIGGC